MIIKNILVENDTELVIILHLNQGNVRTQKNKTHISGEVLAMQASLNQQF